MALANTITKQWLCLRCQSHAARAFSTTASSRAVGPEHPRYIDVPQPPQQSAERAEKVRGTLPVPRELFRGKYGLPKNVDARVINSTKEPTRSVTYRPGSREFYNSKLAKSRRQALREGTHELRRRMDRSAEMQREHGKENAAKRKAQLQAPERDDEKLTAASTNINLKNYIQLKLTPKEQAEKIRMSEFRYKRHLGRKEQELSGHLHSLYTHARTFIVNQEQLDEAIEKAFGTDESPVVFSSEFGAGQDAHSIWALGRPPKLSELADLTANSRRLGTTMAAEDLNISRINRVAEVLTGGEFGQGSKDQPIKS